MAALEADLLTTIEHDDGTTSLPIIPLYAFSRRESVEEWQPDGSVRKINIFRHDGFVLPPAAVYGWARPYEVRAIEIATCANEKQ